MNSGFPPLARGFANTQFTVVIATHDRRHIVARAIVSALAQDGGAPEILVVDDASSDGTARYVATAFPTVRFERRETMDGPSVCRNLGLRLATTPWVLILDDDDELRRDALRTIAQRLAAFPDVAQFPVLKFRRSDSTMTVPFQISRPADLTSSTRRGDFASVWNRELAVTQGWAYPEHYLGAEGVLWVEIAARHGLPTWADCVAIAHQDAGRRLSDMATTVRLAVERAKIEDGFVRALAPFETDQHVRDVVTERIALSGVYSLLAGHRGRALSQAWKLLARRPRAALKLVLASGLPTRLVVHRAEANRRRQDALKASEPPPETGWE